MLWLSPSVRFSFALSLTDLYTLGSTDHAAKLHELPDDTMAELLPVAKKIALAQNLENYNVLQNNGAVAHQEVEWVLHIYRF